MPTFLASAIATVGSALLATEGVTFGAFLLTNAMAISTGVLLLGGLAYSGMQRRKAERQARDAYNAAQVDRLVNVQAAIVARDLVLGRVRKGGSVFFRGSAGSTKETYAMAIAVAGHEIDGIEQIYLNDVPVTLDGAGNVLTAPYSNGSIVSQQAIAFGAATVLPETPIPGSVSVTRPNPASTGLDGDPDLYVAMGFTLAGNTVTIAPGDAGAFTTIHYQYSSAPAKAKVWWYLGTPSQAADARLQALFPSLWTSSHRARGCAYIVCEFTYDETAFPSGLPVVTALVRGARCYDPRTGLTAFTTNPALQMRHVYTHPQFGKAVAVSAAEDARIAAAASACDTPQGWVVGGVTTTAALYSSGITVPFGTPASNLFDDLATAMAGMWAFAGGELHLKAGIYTAPTMTLQESDLATVQRATSGQGQSVTQSPISISPHRARADKFNVANVRIWDAAQDYKQVPLPPLKGAALITRDGTELAKELNFAAVTFAPQALHIAGVMMRDARDPLTVVLAFKLTAYPVELFDTIALTIARYGWSAKAFLVMQRHWSPEGHVVLTLKETAASIFTPDAAFLPTGYAANTQLTSAWYAPPLGTLTVSTGDAETTTLADGTVLSGARISWPAVIDMAVLQGGKVEIQYRNTAGAEPWASETVDGDQPAVAVRGRLKDGNFYLFRGRTRTTTAIGVWSAQLTLKIVGRSTAAGSITSPACTALYLSLLLTWTNPTSREVSTISIEESSDGSTWAFRENIPIGGGYGLGAKYLIGGLDAGVLRYFRLRTRDGAGNYGSYTAAVSATTLAVPALSVIADRLWTSAGNLVDASWWAPGATMQWPLNEVGGDSDTIVWGVGPKGHTEALWQAVAAGVSGANADGGWNYDSSHLNTNWFKVDPTKTYRFAIPVKKTVNASGCNAWWGVAGGAVSDLPIRGGAVNPNPYFAVYPTPLNKWCLLVGYVFPAGSTGVDDTGAGIYDMATGDLLGAGGNYRWAPGVDMTGTRAYQFYANPGDTQYFGKPMVHIVDGSEPSLKELLQTTAYKNNLITINADGTLSGAGSGQVTLVGVGYTQDNGFVATGNATLKGGRAFKVGGVSAWDSQVYSKLGFQGGSFARGVFESGGTFMGLNTDPTTNADWTSLDYSIYAPGAGGTYQYGESGSLGSLGVTVVVGDVMTVMYDGAKVVYLINGTVVRTVTASPALTLYFDSSLGDPNVSAITAINFGPLTTGAWNDISLVTTNVTLQGNTATKTGGSNNSWDSQVYSTEAYLGPSRASVKYIGPGDFMLGLNSDPATNSSYTSLDYAIYNTGVGGIYQFWSNNSLISGLDGTVASGDVLTLDYDGTYIRPFRNGAQMTASGTPYAYYAGPGLALALDTSFYASGCVISQIRYEKGSSNPSALMFNVTGKCSVLGNTATRAAGSTAWDSKAYSAQSFTGGAFVTARYARAGELIVALNTDPWTTNSYTGIDYGLYPMAGGGANEWGYVEGGAAVSLGVTAAVGDVVSVVYHGFAIQYLVNGAVRRTLQIGGGKQFYADIAIAQAGATVDNIAFGAMTTKNFGSWRLVARGYSGAAPGGISGGLYGLDWPGSPLNIGPTISYTVLIFDRATGLYLTGATYNVYGSTANATSMANLLNSQGNDKVVVVYSEDEPQTNRMYGTLPAAMYRCGASPGVYGSPSKFKFRSAYVLIGIPGCGEGNGYEAYAGTTDNNADAVVDINFDIGPNLLRITGSATNPMVPTKVIEPYAATVVYETRWDSTGHDFAAPSCYFRTGTLESFSITNDDAFDYRIIVTFTGYLTQAQAAYPNEPAGQGLGIWRLSGTTADFWLEAYSNGYLNATATFVLPAGATESYMLACYAPFPSVASGNWTVFQLTNGSFKVEVIKR